MVAKSLLATSGLATGFVISLVGTPAIAGQPVATEASIEISEPGAVRVVRDAPLSVLIASGLMAQFGATFSMSAPTGKVAALGFVSATGLSRNLLFADGASVITGTTVYGEALSISIGGENTEANTGSQSRDGLSLTRVIAQYN